MNFTIEQVKTFVKSWREYQKAGKHKREAVTLNTIPPQTHYSPSSLTCAHHVLYSYLRNLPLDRGLKGSYEEKRSVIRGVKDDFWWYSNPHYASYKKKWIDVFGETFTDEIVKGFSTLADTY